MRTAKYYRDASEEMHTLARLCTTISRKALMLRLADGYAKMAECLENHDLNVEATVQRALRQHARELSKQLMDDLLKTDEGQA